MDFSVQQYIENDIVEENIAKDPMYVLGVK